LAVEKGGKIVLSVNMPVSGRESDAKLARWLAEQLQAVGLTPVGISHWTVGTGPGSFSGLRVGISLTMGICAASGATVHGIPTDLALARRAAGAADSATVGVLHDARQGQLILGLYRLENGGWRELQAPEVLETAQVAEAAKPAGILTWLTSPRMDLLAPQGVPARLAPQEAVDAALLLDVPGWPQPADEAAREASCQPVYVRPAVFVPPREIRTTPDARRHGVTS
jgi:tRNA threonylcarbamoyladenosine biosynthesis protein TsaB